MMKRSPISDMMCGLTLGMTLSGCHRRPTTALCSRLHRLI